MQASQQELFNQTKEIKFVDLQAQYNELKDELDYSINDVILKASYIGGPQVTQFESSFAKYLDVNYVLGVGNGTDALYIALKALGIGTGDEVITVANSFIATSEAITQTGATVVFADCNAEDQNISIEDVSKKITSKTKAIIPVHLYGLAADMDPLMDLAKSRGIFVVEDCAQAHGARYKGQRVGTFGDVACFSFYPGKNLGAFGDAGAVATNNEELFLKMKIFSNHGRLEKYNHLQEGINSRLDSIQAAVLNVKLKYLEEWNLKRKALANYYNKELIEFLDIPKTYSDRSHVYHLYVVNTDNRDKLEQELKLANIPVMVHYPVALPFLTAYQNRGYSPKDYPNAHYQMSRILSLPMHPHLASKQIEFIVTTVVSAFKNKII